MKDLVVFYVGGVNPIFWAQRAIFWPVPDNREAFLSRPALGFTTDGKTYSAGRPFGGRRFRSTTPLLSPRFLTIFPSLWLRPYTRRRTLRCARVRFSRPQNGLTSDDRSRAKG